MNRNTKKQTNKQNTQKNEETKTNKTNTNNNKTAGTKSVSLQKVEVGRLMKEEEEEEEKEEGEGEEEEKLVSRFGLAVRRWADKRKDLCSIPLRLSFLFRKVVVCGHGLVTFPITSY